MKKLLELEAKLRKAKEELEKAASKVNMGHSSFTMDHVNEIANMKDHKAAKERAHSIVDKSTANPKNKVKMKTMINGSKNTNHLAQGMSNHVLAHPSEGLKVIKSDLEKNAQMGYGSDTGMPPGTASSGDVNMTKKEKHEDEKEDKKMMAEAMDQHNEKKHGEAKDKDSAYKDMNVEKGCSDYAVKFEKNGQWRMEKKVREPSYGSASAYENPVNVEGAAKEKKYQGGDPRHAETRGYKTKAGLEREIPEGKKTFTSGSSGLRDRTKLNETTRNTTNTTSGKKVEWNR